MKNKRKIVTPLPDPKTLGPIEVPKLIKLDIGCGKNKVGSDWTGVDSIKFDGVDVVVDLAERNMIVDATNEFAKWPWDDNSVDEVHSSHFVEHLDAIERVHFCNELYRILKPGAKATIIAPNWSSNRAYGDPSHKWPPISDFWFYYLDKNWRLGHPDTGLGANAPHTDIKYNPQGYSCHFEVKWGFSLDPEIQSRNQDYQNEAMKHWVNVCQDVHATFVKRID